MSTLKSLQGLSKEELFLAHKEAFKDYKFQWSEQAFYNMLERRGFNGALSFGVFEDDKLVSFTMNGFGVFNGLRSAYDMSTATIKEYRSKGYSTQIFNYSIPYLIEEGVDQYVLEVLKENDAAFSVYSKLGFEISREFNYFIKETSELESAIEHIPEGIQLKEIDLSYIHEMRPMCDMLLSWQNSFESLLRSKSLFNMVGAFRDDKLIGYGIMEPMTGDISQLAVNKQERRKGVGTVILRKLILGNQAETVRIANIDIKYFDIISFIESNGFPNMGAQYEMIKRIEK